MTIAGNDALLPGRSLFDAAGSAARGTLIAIGWLPVSAMPPAGRALAADLARRRSTSARAHPFAVYAAHATEVALDAIARSDGTRRSVARALLRTDLRDGALGPTRFDARGDLRGAPVTILRARARGRLARTRLDRRRRCRRGPVAALSRRVASAQPSVSSASRASAASRWSRSNCSARWMRPSASEKTKTLSTTNAPPPASVAAWP